MLFLLLPLRCDKRIRNFRYLKVYLRYDRLVVSVRYAMLIIIYRHLDGGYTLSDDAKLARCLIREIHDTATPMRSSVNYLHYYLLAVGWIFHEKQSAERMCLVSTLKRVIVQTRATCRAGTVHTLRIIRSLAFFLGRNKAAER